MSKPYDIGDVPEFLFKPSSGLSTAVTFSVTRPDGTFTNYLSGTASEVSGEGTNGWTLTLPELVPGDEGIWYLNARSTAGVTVAEQSAFAVIGRPASAPVERWPIMWLPTFDPNGIAPVLIDMARASAETILWSLSGRRYGVHTVTEKYRLPSSGVCDVIPYLDDDMVWHNGLAGAVNRIHLEHVPVREITAVSVAGVALLPSQWEKDGDSVVRLGGWFPNVAETAAAQIEVTYSYGLDVDALGQLAMGEVAAEILAGFTTGRCRLPSHLVSLSKQGVTQAFDDASTLFRDRRLGLPIADQWLLSVNPDRLTMRSRVYSPDMARRVG